MKKYGLRIETFSGAGRYQHKVFDIGIDSRNRDRALSDEAVELLKKVNERVYDEMPVGSMGLVSIVTFSSPRKPR